MAKVKINVTIDDELLRQVDDYCDENFTNRSMLISQQLTAVINQDKIIKSISDLSLALKKASEIGTIDEETEKKIKGFEFLANMLTSK